MGGTERTLVDLVTGLDRTQFAPVVWTIADPGPLASEIPDEIPVRSLEASSKTDIRVPLRLMKELRAERPEILQSFLYFDNVLARLVGLAAPETTVITGVREVPNSMSPHRELIDRATLFLSDFIISNSEAGAEWIIDRGANREVVNVVRNGRDIDGYNVAIPARYRQTVGIPQGPVVGTVGRLVKRKGHLDLIAAWPTVQNEHPDSQLVLVGEGPEREALERQTEELGISDSVHLLGSRHDVPELLALFDLFVFPSYYEGLPGALLEAMCAGLPIITTPVDGCAELISDEKQGLHIPVGDSAAIGAAINRLLSDEGLGSKLGENANQRASESFSLEVMVEEYCSVYRRFSQ
ncbi:glycosyltransferase [Haladaptatus sp. DYSN1]|uniref:glycosyltransferase n=1 Tax=unclassified Haladaptatus TaxID=2622732 RepID=UPI0024074E7A|nr:glycosyltransferase [Haladaptatus sp. DYSN1]